MATPVTKPANVQREWFVVDLEDVVLGRAATQIAKILRGKHKATYMPSVDAGDYVVVINADKARLTGNKMEQKQYYRHTGYPGGLRSANARQMQADKPEEMIVQAVKGMLPRNKLGRSMLKKLKIYRGADHPHAAQSPRQLTL